VDISVDINNVGKYEGDEVVQLYIHKDVSSISRPIKELKGFKRVTLKPGEKETIKFTLGEEELAFYDINMNLVVEPGLYEVMVGSSSEDIRLKGSFEVK
jgi:beta-glucosidase